MILPITHRSTFAALSADGKRVRSGPVRMTHLADAPRVAPGERRVGFVFGRRFGNAVERNRARRRLKAVIRSEFTDESVVPGAYLFAGSRSLLDVPFAELQSGVRSCLQKVA